MSTNSETVQIYDKNGKRLTVPKALLELASKMRWTSQDIIAIAKLNKGDK